MKRSVAMPLLYGMVFSVTTGASGQVNLQEEQIEMVVEWIVPDSIGSTAHSFAFTVSESSIHTFGDYTYAVFTDAQRRPRVVKLRDGNAQVEFLAGTGYQAGTDHGHNKFSIGIDPDGYIHVVGDMHAHPFDGNDHLEEPYFSAPCLYWRSDEPEDISSFTFRGNDETHGIPGVGFTYPRFVNGNDGTLYFTSRQWVRNDHHWTYNPGKINLGLARYDADSRTWIPLGAEAPIFSDVHPRADTANWEPNHNEVIFWSPTGVDSTCYQTWHRDIFFDSRNRLHLAVGMNTDNSGNGSHPGSGTAVCYAYSDDQGDTWRRADGSTIEELPMRSSTTDLVASGHWYSMEAGVTVSPNGHPLVAYRYSPDGSSSSATSRWREYNGSRWGPEHTMPDMYRRAVPRVDTKGVITITEYGTVYRTTDYTIEGVEHDMPYDMYSLDEGFFRSTGTFRFTAKVNGRFGIVRLDITPEGPVSIARTPKCRRGPLMDGSAHDVALYDLRGRTVAAKVRSGNGRACSTGGGMFIVCRNGVERTVGFVAPNR